MSPDIKQNAFVPTPKKKKKKSCCSTGGQHPLDSEHTGSFLFCFWLFDLGGWHDSEKLQHHFKNMKL